jgi:hypothetical protein
VISQEGGGPCNASQPVQRVRLAWWVEEEEKRGEEKRYLPLGNCAPPDTTSPRKLVKVFKSGGQLHLFGLELSVSMSEPREREREKERESVCVCVWVCRRLGNDGHDWATLVLTGCQHHCRLHSSPCRHSLSRRR